MVGGWRYYQQGGLESIIPKIFHAGGLGQTPLGIIERLRVKQQGYVCKPNPTLPYPFFSRISITLPSETSVLPSTDHHHEPLPS